MFQYRIFPLSLCLAALVTFGSGVAQAAPQALALVATHGNVGLTCEGQECSAELTSFCLDAGRYAPASGTAYHLAGPGLIRLTGTTEDGQTVELDARSHLRFESARRHTAVRVSVDRGRLEALGIRLAQVSVEENVALLPEAQSDDPNPITAAEAELFSGPLRKLGTRLVDSNTERMQAARVTSRVINLLPSKGKARTAFGEKLWQRATAASREQSLTPAARKRARGAFELCRFIVNVSGTANLRHCLQQQHDNFMDFLNSEYWEAVKTGT